MKKVFFLVGHENFGKSRTLVELTGSTNRKYLKLGQVECLVRRKSNDDIKKDLLDEAKEIVRTDFQCVIIALCPNFESPERWTRDIIEVFRNAGFDVHFFVLKDEYSGSRVVSDKEVAILKSYGTTVLYEKSREAAVRAKELEKYILGN